MEPIRTRQIHLDFHTSEMIRGIGSRFDKRQWQQALQTGRVNLINVFAKCHHSWCYYPTTAGMRHPHLRLDLLGAQIEACHEIGVKCPIYFTVGWSAADAELHPEWCMRNRDGSICAPGWDRDAAPDTPKPGVQWKHLCPSGGYHELMLAQVEELCTGYDVDGFWFDIYQAERLCWCDTCLHGMLGAGLAIDHAADVQRYRADTIRRHMAELVRLITGHHPEASIYFNGVTRLDRDANTRYRLYRHNTQNDLEDLPTTWGGYDKLALRARYFANVGKPYVAMSGKFHTSWGEFGGFKHADALRFEAASMVAYGAACNFGDHLHPSGEMDLDTYRNIGAAFAYVERIEQYGVGGEPAARLGLWRSGSNADDEGVSSMLLETQTDYRVVADDDDLSGYDAIILPGGRCLTAADARRLDRFTGGLLILGAGGLLAGEDRFAVDAGVEYVGPGRYDVDFLCAGEAVGDGLVRSPFLCYEAGLRTTPAAGTEVLARIREPHFSRTYGAYCGHLNTPYGPADAVHPGAVRNGQPGVPGAQPGAHLPYPRRARAPADVPQRPGAGLPHPDGHDRHAKRRPPQPAAPAAAAPLRRPPAVRGPDATRALRGDRRPGAAVQRAAAADGTGAGDDCRSRTAGRRAGGAALGRLGRGHRPGGVLPPGGGVRLLTFAPTGGVTHGPVWAFAFRTAMRPSFPPAEPSANIDSAVGRAAVGYDGI